jgi:hypothetical protein
VSFDFIPWSLAPENVCNPKTISTMGGYRNLGKEAENKPLTILEPTIDLSIISRTMLKIMQAHHNFLECKWPTKLLSASCANQQPNSIVHVENLDNTRF